MRNDDLQSLNHILSICGIEFDLNFVQKRPTNVVLENIIDLLNKGIVSNYAKFQEMIRGIETNRINFTQFLQPVKSNYDLYLFSTPKSLCQICLMIPKLNDFLIEMLVNKICECSLTNDDEDNELAILCLNQFKWNVYNKNMNEIVDKLLDVGYIANNFVQNHLISIFPDICQDKCNPRLAEKLHDWMSSNNYLITSSLDTISKLNLPTSFLKEIELLVMNMLDSATMGMLPSLITFLIKNTDKNNLVELIDKIRINVEFENLNSMFNSAVSSTPLMHVRNESSCGVKLINSLKINLQFNPYLRKAWLKSISTKSDSVRSPSFDFIILLIIFNEYKVEMHVITNIIKSKITKEQFTQQTIETVFKYHFSILKPIYRGFLTIINSIMISDKGLLLDFAKEAYYNAFMNPNKDFIIDQIFEYLIADISTKPKSNINAILEVLKHLAENCRNKIQLFYTQISGLLSNNLEFNSIQIYNIYSIFGIIAFKDISENDDIFGDEKQIRNHVILLVKKQLQNPNFLIKRNGGIGAVTLMKYLCNVDVNTDSTVNAITNLLNSAGGVLNDTEEEQQSQMTNSQKIVSKILKLLLSYSETVPELIIVVFDELYRLISTGEITEINVEKIIEKIISDSFLYNFTSEIDEIDEIDKKDRHLLFGVGVGLDYCEIAVIVSQSNSSSNLIGKTAKIHLPAHFRLLALLELRNKKSLCEINALFGCPVRFVGGFDSVEAVELQTVINWLIEVVNAFSSDINNGGGIDNFRLKMVQRMKLIVEQVSNLQSMLLLSVQSKPTKLPIIQASNVGYGVVGVGGGGGGGGSHLLINVTEIIIKKVSVKRKTVKKKKKSKKSKQNHDNNNNKTTTVGNSIQESDESEELFETDKIENATTSVRCKLLEENLRFCFRELDLSVFTMLSSLTKSDLVLFDHNSELLGWKELKYYLSDLWLKVEHCFRDRNELPNGFNPPNANKNGMLFRNIDQVDNLTILENIISMQDLFKLIISKSIEFCLSDEILENVDDPCFLVFEFVLKILSKIFHYLKNNLTDSGDEMIKRLLDGLSPVNYSKSLLKQILSIREKIPSINIAAAYCEFVSELLTITSDNESEVSMLDLTAKFLGTKWISTNMTIYKSSVLRLFEIHLLLLSDKWFEVIVSAILPEMQTIVTRNIDDNESEPVYACLDKTTILGVFKLVSDFILKKCKNLSKVSYSQRNTLEMLESWEKIVVIVKLFTIVISNNKESNMILSFIKFSREFIKFIIKNLMPILDNMLRHENAQVIKLLTEIQFVTRFIQRLCTHCKQKNNLSSASLVPQVRRYLETFMFRVKKMLCINKCSGDSINILFLANKDIHGRRIEESVQSENEEEDEDNEEEVCTDVSEELNACSDDVENESLNE